MSSTSARLWWRGARPRTLGLGVVPVLVGVADGAAAGFWSGWTATVLLGLTDFALALPRVVLLLPLVGLAAWVVGVLVQR